MNVYDIGIRMLQYTNAFVEGPLPHWQSSKGAASPLWNHCIEVLRSMEPEQKVIQDPILRPSSLLKTRQKVQPPEWRKGRQAYKRVYAVALAT